jgi:hypothetical protein
VLRRAPVVDATLAGRGDSKGPRAKVGARATREFVQVLATSDQVGHGIEDDVVRHLTGTLPPHARRRRGDGRIGN